MTLLHFFVFEILDLERKVALRTADTDDPVTSQIQGFTTLKTKTITITSNANPPLTELSGPIKRRIMTLLNSAQVSALGRGRVADLLH